MQVKTDNEVYTPLDECVVRLSKIYPINKRLFYDYIEKGLIPKGREIGTAYCYPYPKLEQLVSFIFFRRDTLGQSIKDIQKDMQAPSHPDQYYEDAKKKITEHYALYGTVETEVERILKNKLDSVTQRRIADKIVSAIEENGKKLSDKQMQNLIRNYIDSIYK